MGTAERHARRSIERRHRHDRRRRPTTLYSALLHGGRRKGFRRTHEGKRAYVDCPSPKVVLLVLWVVVASALDAVLTPQRLVEGFREANPVMAVVVAYDTEVFIALKMAAASAGCWILAAHQQFVLAVTGLYGLAILYTGVLAIHGLLIVAGS